MSLTLRMEELSRFRVSADFGSIDGRIALALKPAVEKDFTPVSTMGVLIHFETVVENGCNKLHVFASPEREDKRPLSGSTASSNLAGDFNFPFDDNHLAIGKEASLPQFTEDYISNFGNPGLISNQSFVDLANGFQPTLPDNQPNYNASDDLRYLTQGIGSEEALGEEPGVSYVIPDPVDGDMFTFPSPRISASFKDDTTPSDSPWSMIGMSETTSDAASTPQSTATPETGSPAPTQRPRRLNCLHPKCKRRFMSEYTRKLHMGTHEPKARHPCQMGCNETFSRQHDRLRHEVAKHGRPCEWLCDRCRRFFSCQATRDKHKCPGNTSPS